MSFWCLFLSWNRIIFLLTRNQILLQIFYNSFWVIIFLLGKIFLYYLEFKRYFTIRITLIKENPNDKNYRKLSWMEVIVICNLVICCNILYCIFSFVRFWASACFSVTLISASVCFFGWITYWLTFQDHGEGDIWAFNFFFSNIYI